MHHTTFERNFRKELKEKNIRLRIWTTENKIKLSDGKHEFLFSARNSENFYWITISQGPKSEAKDLTGELYREGVRYWREMAKLEKKNGVIVKDHFRDNAAVLGEGYVRLVDTLPEHVHDFPFIPTLSLSGLAYYTVYEHKTGELKKLLGVLHTFSSFFCNLVKEDPTVNISFHCGSYTSNMKTFFNYRIDFYYKGFEGRLRLDYRNDEEMVVKFEEKEHLLPTKEEAKQFLAQLFQSIQNKQRIKNLYDPPKKYFYRALSSASIDKERGETIYQDLLHFYSPEEIENHFASNIGIKNVESHRLGYGSRYLLYYVLDRVYMMLVEDEHFVGFYPASKEEMETRLHEILVAFMTRTLKEQLQEDAEKVGSMQEIEKERIKEKKKLG